MSQRKKKKFNKKYIAWGIGVIQFIISVLLGIRLFTMGLLPIGYMIGYGIFTVVLAALTFGLAKKRVAAVIMCILSIMISALMVYGMVALNKVHNTVEEVTSNPEEVKTEMAVVVLKESEAEEITDLSEFMIGYMSNQDANAAEQVMDEINESVGGEVNFHEFSNATEMADALYAKTMNAIVINKAFIDTFADIEGYEDFSNKTKIIYSYEVVDYIKIVDEKESNLNQFVVYISGIDTFGDVSVKSRSDVNILAVVNTKTKKIQLINTPRDYYVELPISNGSKDKLTHAGIYGVENSIGALEMLYGVEVDYFVRMNFSGFEGIIDSLGGIDVYSEYDFTVEPIKHYTKGMNHLSGIEALAFARERYSFAAGDLQRGKNQMEVIRAMIDKLSSPELLYNYTGVLDSIAGTFQTNMSSDEIYALVRKELANPAGWTIESYSVTGSGSSMGTYTSPNSKAYVMIPNDADVQTAKEKIQAVLDN